MARRRMVDPEFWSDEGITSLPLGARLLAIGILNFSDDRGIFPDSPRKVRNLVFPGDTFSTEDITSWLNGLIEIHYLYRFALDGTPYFKVRNWDKYQHIVNPSDKGFLPKDANIPMPDYNSPSIGVSSQDNSPSIGVVPEVKLSKVKLSKLEANVPSLPSLKGDAPATAKKRKPKASVLEKPQDLLDLFLEDELIQAHNRFPALDFDWEAGKCLDWYNSRGGCGNWKLAYKNWLGKSGNSQGTHETPISDYDAFNDALLDWRHSHPGEDSRAFVQDWRSRRGLVYEN